MVAKSVRRRIEGQRGAAQFVVEAVIVQQHLVVAAQLARCGAAALAARAAHLEKIGKVVGEQNRRAATSIGAIAVIAQAEPLIGRVAPEKDRAQNMQRVLLQDDALIGEESGLVRSTTSAALSSRKFEPSSSGCVPLIRSSQAREKPGVVMRTGRRFRRTPRPCRHGCRAR